MATKAKRRRKTAEADSFEPYHKGVITPEIKLTVLLVLVGRRWRSLLDDKLRPTGQSSARMEALSVIMNAPAGSAQAEIARRLRIEGPTLTRMIDTLEKDGLVARLPAPSDKRSKHLQLTAQGETALGEIFAVAETYRARLLEGLDEQTMAMATGFLAGLLERLDGGLPGDEA